MELRPNASVGLVKQVKDGVKVLGNGELEEANCKG